ncbi:hypothetical protein CPB86DRAFT_787785 [Serendipita vermifera]|nr:hypothetical protein CPB86DRAFT_787785 [Serendipita vermifera]
MMDEGSSVSSTGSPINELGCRSVKVHPLNLNISHIPSTFAITNTSRYKDINSQLNKEIGDDQCNLTLLEESFGPWPSWKFPDDNAKIPHTVHVLYLVDRNRPFVLALLRTEYDDRPLAIDGITNSTMSPTRILDELKLAVHSKGFQLKSAKFYGGREDLVDEIYDYASFQKLPTFPTIFFILTEHSETVSKFKARPTGDNNIPVPFRITLSQIERLLKYSLDLHTMTLQCIHISQALLHLMVSLSETHNEDIDTFWLNYSLRRVGDDFEQIVTNLSSQPIDDLSGFEEEARRLNAIFLTCCDNYPGAVVVRRSYDVFQTIKESDRYDWEHWKMQKSLVGGASVPEIEPMDKGDTETLVESVSTYVPPPDNKLLTQLTIVKLNRDKAQYSWRCSANGCDYECIGRIQKSQVLKHASKCSLLSEELQRAAKSAIISEISSKKLKANMEKPSAQLVRAKERPTMQSSKARYLIVLMICCDGFDIHILDSPRWKNFIHLMNPQVKIPSGDTFKLNLIPSEAIAIQKQQESLLQQSANLTMTFNGGSTRKRHSVYTIHVTTQDRKVYLIAGGDGTGHEYDTNWLIGIWEKWVNHIGPHRFVAIGSDSTALTNSVRHQLTGKYPTVLNFGDPCHHLNLMLKEIMELPDFKEVIRDVNSIISFFNIPNKASIKLKELALASDITRRREKLGRTHFVAHYWSVLSVYRSNDQIKELVRDGKVTFGLRSTVRSKRLRDLYIAPAANNLFKNELLRYLHITGPIAKAIQCLESANLTVADVYVLWLAIAATLWDLFSRPGQETSISEELRSKITAIITRHHKGFMNETPSDIYFTGLFLDPRYMRSDILRKPTTMSHTITVPQSPSHNVTESGDDSLKTPIPAAYARVRDFLKTMLIAEDRAPIHNRLYATLSNGEFIRRFREQLYRYAWGFEPFNQQWDGNGTLKWWMSLEGHPEASCLAMLAIKIHSICPNTMADEQTMSTFTWLNSPIRNRHDLSAMVEMAQVQQYHGMEDKELKLEDRCKPFVRWRDIDPVVFRRRYMMVADIVKTTTFNNDNNVDVWESEDESNEQEFVEDILSFMRQQDSLVDISSLFLRDLLSEHAVAGASPAVEASAAVYGLKEAPHDVDALMHDW